MSAWFRRNSILKKRLKNVEKEISSIDGDLQDLNKAVDHPERSYNVLNDLEDEVVAKKKASKVYERKSALRAAKIKMADKDVAEEFMNFKDRTREDLDEDAMVVHQRSEDFKRDRFAGYLSKSFQSVRPLRHERRIQRNKAVVMLVFVLMLLYLVVSHFFL